VVAAVLMVVAAVPLNVSIMAMHLMVPYDT